MPVSCEERDQVSVPFSFEKWFQESETMPVSCEE